ncbi:MAG: hypothetical protein ACUVTU_12680 [Desulfurispora sp.]|uniref:hypothetical protein n=1 Tax=Desulfurispora sp. TaxID=3014275 RepID=UPI00404B7F39
MKTASCPRQLPVFIITLLLVFITSGQAAFSAPEPAWQERSAAHRQAARLSQQNLALLQELLGLEARQQQLARQFNRAAQAEQAARQAAQDAYRAYRRAQQERDAARQQLALWLNWYYRHSWLELLGLLLDASDAADFARRTYYVYTLTRSFARDWQQASRACQNLDEAQHAWQKRQAHWQDALNRLAQNRRQLDQAIAQKRAYLAGLQKQSAQLADYLTGLESYCLNSTGILSRLQETLTGLPWQKVSSYQVGWQGGRATVRVEDAEITRLLNDDRQLPPGSRVALAPDRWSIHIPAHPGWPALTLEGKAENTGDGPVLKPLRLYLDGWPVQQQLLEQLWPPASPDWHFTYGSWRFKVTGLQIVQDAVVIALQLD